MHFLLEKERKDVIREFKNKIKTLKVSDSFLSNHPFIAKNISSVRLYSDLIIFSIFAPSEIEAEVELIPYLSDVFKDSKISWERGVDGKRKCIIYTATIYKESVIIYFNIHVNLNNLKGCEIKLVPTGRKVIVQRNVEEPEYKTIITCKED